jgi:hypothetical protein
MINFLFPITENDIIIACSRIKSTATGVDDVPINFIKMLIPTFIPHLAYIFNNCLPQSYLANIWKQLFDETVDEFPTNLETNENNFSFYPPVDV